MNRFSILTVALCLAINSQVVRANNDREDKTARSSDRSSEMGASELIGKKVINNQSEDLGKVNDVIINIGNGRAPFAVIGSGSAFSGGRMRVAVPLTSLQAAPDGKSLLLDASKEQFRAASKTPTGAWASVAECDWAHRVDAYYGEPVAHDRYSRDSAQTNDDARTYVRDPVPKGAEVLMTPQDAELCQKICERTDALSIRVQNGVTHIYGEVDSEEARQKLETKVRAVPGVNVVESHVRVRGQ